MAFITYNFLRLLHLIRTYTVLKLASPQKTCLWAQLPPERWRVNSLTHRDVTHTDTWRPSWRHSSLLTSLQLQLLAPTLTVARTFICSNAQLCWVLSIVCWHFKGTIGKINFPTRQKHRRLSHTDSRRQNSRRFLTSLLRHTAWCPKSRIVCLLCGI